VKSQDWKEAHGEFESEHQPAPPATPASTRDVRPSHVVVAPPALDDDLGLAESVEDFAVEQLIAQASVGALDVYTQMNSLTRTIAYFDELLSD
jgi:hypothetical protein